MPLQAPSSLHQDAYHTLPPTSQQGQVQASGGGGGERGQQQGEVQLRANGILPCPLLVPAGGPRLVGTRRDL